MSTGDTGSVVKFQKTVKRFTESQSKVVLTAIMAGPQGIAQRGTVLSLPDDQASELIAGGFARPYDAERDKRASSGFVTAPSKFT